MSQTKTIAVTIPGSNFIEEQSRQEKLQTIAQLPSDDLDRLSQIAGNPKALSALKSKWLFLKTMF